MRKTRTQRIQPEFGAFIAMDKMAIWASEHTGMENTPMGEADQMRDSINDIWGSEHRTQVNGRSGWTKD